jgi:methyltransferase (TIGR00027 family)
VVLLAAGLDARAFRLDWPAGVELFELDHPDVLDFKQEVLDRAGARPRCGRHVITADLAADWAPRLRAAGLDPDQPVAWLAEGLLTYLDHDPAHRLLATITALSVAGATLALEGGGIAAARFMDTVMALPAMAELAPLHRGGLDRDPASWLSEHGWRTAVHASRGLAEQHRPIPDAASGRFVVATRS